MKSVRFKSRTTDGNISHNYVALSIINTELVISVVQRILIDKKDSKDWKRQNFKVVYIFGSKAIIHKQTTLKASTLQSIMESVDILLTIADNESILNKKL